MSWSRRQPARTPWWSRSPVPPPPARLVNSEVLARLRPGATVVSVGRGTVIDEPALIDALRSGQVGLAVLDVVAVEPLPPESALWGLPNVVLSPHTAANSPAERGSSQS